MHYFQTQLYVPQNASICTEIGMSKMDSIMEENTRTGLSLPALFFTSYQLLKQKLASLRNSSFQNCTMKTFVMKLVRWNKYYGLKTFIHITLTKTILAIFRLLFGLHTFPPHQFPSSGLQSLLACISLSRVLLRLPRRWMSEMNSKRLVLPPFQANKRSQVFP